MAETKGINKGIRDVNSQLGTFGKTAGKIGGLVKGAFVAAGAAVATAKIGGFLKDSISAASDLNETISKTEQIFGSAAPAVLKFSDTAAKTLGQTKTQALDAATTFATFGKSAGLAGNDLSKFAKQNTVLASDLASFFNTEPQEAIDAIGAAFRGEAEPIRKYGVLLDDATLRQEALKQGLIKSTKEALTPQQKVLAAQAQIFKQTSDAQGDFERTSGGLANQQRILSAQFTDLKAKIGTALLPVVTKVVTFLNANFVPAVNAVRDTLGPVVDRVRDFFSAGSQGTSALQPVADFIKTQFIPAFMGIVGAVQGLWAAVQPIIMQVAQAFRSQWSEIAPQVRSIFNSIREIILSVMELIKIRIEQITAVIRFIWSKWGNQISTFIATTFKNIFTVVAGVLKAVSGIIKTVLAVMKGDWKGAWNGIKQILAGVWQAIKGIVSQGVNIAKTLMSAAWSAVKALTKAAWDGIKKAVSSAVSGLISTVTGIQGKIISGLAGIGSWLISAGMDLIRGMIQGVGNMASSLASKAKEVVSGAISAAKGALGIKSPSKVFKKIGQQTIQGFVVGIRGGKKKAKSAIGDLMDSVKKVARKHDINDKRLKKAIKRTADERRKVLRTAKAYDRLSSRLEKVGKRLKDLRKARDDYDSRTRDSVQGFGNITSLNSAFTADALAQQLQARIDKVKQYRSLLQDLRNKGLNKAMFDDLVQAGVEGGLATAQALAAGGPEAVKQFNSLQSQLNKQANGLGKESSKYMYQAGIDAAQGLVKGLNSRAKKLESAAKRLARAMVKQIKKALKIKSPSRVFQEIGDYSVKGLQIGLENTKGVVKAMTNVSEAMTRSYAPDLAVAGAPAAQAPGGRKNQPSLTLNLNGTFVGTTKEQVGRWFTEAQDAYFNQGGRRRA